MAEGMVTRHRALEESIAMVAQEVKELAVTVQQHSECITSHSNSTDKIQQTLSEFQQSFMDIRQSLQRLERNSTQSPLPPLLPTPTSISTPPTYHSTTIPLLAAPHFDAPANSSIKLPKLEIPYFTGENVVGWLFQIERFFEYHLTPSDHKLTIAAFYMTGTALQWFQWMHTTHQLTTWELFSRNLELRFNPSSYLNHEALLYKLRQTSSVTAYMSEFEALSTRTTGLSTTNLLNCFLSGLRDDIRRELLLLKPQTLPEAIGMAKLVEEKVEGNRPTYPRPPMTKTQAVIQAQPLKQLPPQSIPHRLPIKRLTATEMAARREKGLCFNCDERFTPGHRCKPPQFLCMLADEDSASIPAVSLYETELVDGDSVTERPFEVEAPSPSPEHIPTISLHALEGHFVPSTLRLQGYIQGQPVVILVDSGSTHNFLQTRMAKHLGLPIEP